MNDRERKIDEFLKFFRDIAIQNPNHHFVQEEIYYHLTGFGLPPTENHKPIKYYFNNWIQHFEKDKNLRVFVDPNWSYFCQFTSADGKARSCNEHLKVYVPLDSNHLERGAKEIFEFLSKNGISHGSKIGSQVRFDDIVIRLVNPSDLSKLISFINDNSYIQEGLIPANPFAFNVNGIALAVDGALSYNATVSSMILFYINDKKSKNNLESINVNDFYNFVVNYYNYAFTSSEGLARLESDFPWKSGRFESPEAQFVNYKKVFELMIKSINRNFTFNDYISHYFESANTNLNKQKEEQLRNIKMSANFTKGKIVSNEVIENTNELLLQLIDVMSAKSNNQYAVFSNINRYLITGIPECITRQNNLRNRVINSTFRDDLNQILKNSNKGFVEYAEELLSKRKHHTIGQKNNEKVIRSTVEKQVILRIKEILEIMSNKYGRRTAHINLEQYLKTGDPSKFTRDYNLRERIVNSTFRADLRQILECRSLTLNDYLTTVSDVKIVQSEVFLEQAILETCSKYEEKYLAGESSYSGKDFVTHSLTQLIEHYNYQGFTRDNGIRQNLMDNVSINEIVTIIKEALGIDDSKNISRAEISQLAEQYVDRILSNNNQKKL